MKLKKNFIQAPFSNKKSFCIHYSDETDLKVGVIKLCNHLKKGNFLIQVFVGDELNEKLNKENNMFLKHKNFNYYLIDNLEFLQGLSLGRLRFLNIYSISKNINSIDLNYLKELKNNYTFLLGFDNYLDFVEIMINFDYYDRMEIKNWQSY